MKKVFIGHTSYQEILYKVAKNSIETRSEGVECFPIIQDALRDLNIYNRNADKLGTTEFSLTRFLTPWLAGYNGWALFIDNDVVALADLNELFSLADEKYAVMCVKHDYEPNGKTKLDNQKQTIYPRKNWSSVVLWNCNHPKNKLITPELVNTETPMYMHRFMWLDDEDIGEISCEWNWLVDWYKEPQDGTPKLLHYTEGGPYFKDYQNCDYAGVWKDEFKKLMKRDFNSKDIIDS